MPQVPKSVWDSILGLLQEVAPTSSTGNSLGFFRLLGALKEAVCAVLTQVGCGSGEGLVRKDNQAFSP